MLKRSLMVCALLAPGTLAADEISGDWCAPDGQMLTIKGSRVVAPSGIETDGQYSRHRYQFVMPEGGHDAGVTVVIRQLSEEEALVSFDEGAPVSWTRCRDVTS
ncbi:hypothetical protein [Mameliella alba]|uniref:Secreted protein n=1 Tax=Mameliella alba TaxID=561184 RepID=A0A0B3S3W2_9RHOB|nr:hypothetical protein [Mameliella alba]KHQ53698.1 hypothetical protein OA50_01687 [Mameliella alba]